MPIINECWLIGRMWIKKSSTNCLSKSIISRCRIMQFFFAEVFYVDRRSWCCWPVVVCTENGNLVSSIPFPNAVLWSQQVCSIELPVFPGLSAYDELICWNTRIDITKTYEEKKHLFILLPIAFNIQWKCGYDWQDETFNDSTQTCSAAVNQSVVTVCVVETNKTRHRTVMPITIFSLPSLD